MFVPLAHPPGNAQADFGEAQVVIAGVERKAHYLVVDLPQSDDGIVMAFPAVLPLQRAIRQGRRAGVARDQPTQTLPEAESRSTWKTP
jgi:hypothetical protein